MSHIWMRNDWPSIERIFKEKSQAMVARCSGSNGRPTKLLTSEVFPAPLSPITMILNIIFK